ncbi:MAG: ABC transporter substrate-binding protein [Thermodesulfovibrionales bacterium]
MAVLRVDNPRVHIFALEGFRSVCGATATVFDVQSPHDGALVRDVLRSAPKVIFAIGGDSLSNVAGVKDVPVIFSLVLRPETLASPGGRVTGVAMNLPVETQLDALGLALPPAKRIGVVYDPGETGPMLEELRAAAAKRGYKVVARAVDRENDVFGALDGLRGRIDVLWMLPDITVVSYETVKYMMLFSFEDRVPVYAVSEKYVQNGAFMALGVDPYDMGRQAGEMANRVLAGEDVRKIPVEHARKGHLFLNLATAERLGLEIPAEAIKRAERLYR